MLAIITEFFKEALKHNSFIHEQIAYYKLGYLLILNKELIFRDFYIVSKE